jgi:uncharacterized damage-inducible protein DinB
VSKKALLDDVRQARAELLAAIEGLSADEMVQPGAAGIWSVKDILAHLTAWEAELVTALSGRLSRRYQDAPTLVKIDDIDEWNAEQYHENARRPLDVIWQDFHGVHKHVLRAIEDLDEAILDDPARLEWMEGEPLSYLILEAVIWHEQEHAEDIRGWREQGRGE